MTSSESDPLEGADDGVQPAAGATNDPPAPVVVLAEGHLHPGILFLRMLDGLRSSIFPIIVALLADQTWLLFVVPVGFVLMMSYWVVRFVTFRYVLTTDELVTTEGIFQRQERRIPVNRIQDLNFESSLLRRFFGLVVVSVETASGTGAEASLDSLGVRESVALREALHGVRTSASGGGESGEEAPAVPQETVLYRSSAGELTLLGLTDNRAGAIFVGLFALFEFADQFGMGNKVIGAGSSVLDRVSQLSPPFVVAIAVGVLLLVMIAGWVLAIGASFVKFHDFTLALRDDVLQRRFGLITTRAQTLPRRRIQRVLLEQTPLRRLFDYLVVRADSAGSGMDVKEEARSGRDIVAPSTNVAVGEALVPWLLPGLEVSGAGFVRVSPRIIGRIAAQGAVVALALGLMFSVKVGAWALLALVLVPIAWGLGYLAYRNLGFCDFGDWVGLRWGLIGRYRAFVPLHKVQAVELHAGPVDRLFGVASLVVYVAGGSPTRLHYLPRDQATNLTHALARRAAHSRFVW